jgi:hypothetical protein
MVPDFLFAHCRIENNNGYAAGWKVYLESK